MFLAQLSPAAVTLSDIYIVPVSQSLNLKSIVVCNRNAAASTFRISIALQSEADNVKQYLYYDAALNGNTTFLADVNLFIKELSIIRVYSTNGLMSFTVSGET